MPANNPKLWWHWGHVIEEDFESWADRAPNIVLKNRTGYMIRASNYTDENMMYLPGKYRTLKEAKRRIDELLNEGGA
jgi:hypothetical protein